MTRQAPRPRPSAGLWHRGGPTAVHYRRTLGDLSHRGVDRTALQRDRGRIIRAAAHPSGLGSTSGSSLRSARAPPGHAARVCHGSTARWGHRRSCFRTGWNSLVP